MRKTVVTIIICIASIALLLMVWFLMPDQNRSSGSEINQPTTVSVETSRAKNERHTLVYHYTGKARNTKTIKLATEVPGQLVAVGFLKVGTFYQQGQVVGRIVNPVFDQQLQAKISQYQSLLTSLDPAIKLDHPLMVEQWTKFREQSQKMSDIQSPEFENVRFSNFLRAKGVMTTYYELKSLLVKRTKHTIVAPVAGRVSKVFREDGSVVGSGELIAEIKSNDNVEIEIPVKKEHIDFLQQNKSYTLTTGDATFQATYTGRGNILNGNNYRIKTFFLTGKKSGIIEGEIVNLNLEIPVCNSCLRVPSRALTKNEIFVLQDQIIRKESISVLFTNYDFSYVEGIADSTVIVTSYTNPKFVGQRAKEQ